MRPGIDEGAGIHNLLPLPQPVRPIPAHLIVEAFEKEKTRQGRVAIMVAYASSRGDTGDPIFTEYREHQAYLDLMAYALG